MYCVWLNISVGTDVPWIGALGVVDWAFKNSIVIVIPIILIGDAVVIMIEWIGSIASVEALDKITNSIVIVI